MKKVFLYASCLLLVIGCNNSGEKAASASGDSTQMADSKTEAIVYPYTLDKPYKDWQPGSQQNAVMVLKMIKAWETKNLTECASYFGDTLDISTDYYHQILPKDSILGMLESSWANYASVNVKMQDWESVISKDKKDEWVTIWYKQSWVDKKGKADSMSVINDAKIVNGKITVFDEKVQHYPLAKK